MNDRVYNFAAGPSTMPLSVLERAGSEITNYRGSGMSVMEMSHRSKAFMEIHAQAEEKLRRIMNIPEGYKPLFLQTGATGQFAAIPLNLMGEKGKADYAVTGNFSNLAMKEAKKYGTVNIAADTFDRDHSYIPTQEQLKQLDRYAQALGLAFQVRDDMLDVISSDQELGKPVGSDRANEKSTFVNALGLENCAQLVEKLSQQAADALADFDQPEFLVWLAHALAGRKQ